MDTVTNMSLSLSHKLTDKKNISGCSISDHIILCGSRSTNHGSCWMLNLHLVEQNRAIFSQFDLSSTTNEHLDGTFWSKVGLKYFLKTFGGVDVDAQGLRLSDNIRIRVNELKG